MAQLASGGSKHMTEMHLKPYVAQVAHETRLGLFALQRYLVEGGNPLLQGVEAVGGGGCSELGCQGLQLHHEAGIQGLQKGRLGLLLLHLQALYQLLQLQNKSAENLNTF